MNIEQLKIEISRINDRMHQSVAKHIELTGDKIVDRENIANELDAMDDTKYFELFVDIMLINGHILHLRNHCFKSYCENKDICDDVYVKDDLLYVDYKDALYDRWYKAVINPESVVMIERHYSFIDWNHGKEEVFYKLGIQTY